MSFEPDFLALMASVITLHHQTSTSLYNAPTLDAGIGIPAHITYRSKIVRGDTEENTTSSAQVEVPPPGFIWHATRPPTIVPQFAFTDQVTLLDAIARRVLDVVVCFDEDGTAHHQEIALT